jgi:hypothetical protein
MSYKNAERIKKLMACAFLLMSSESSQKTA